MLGIPCKLLFFPQIAHSPIVDTHDDYVISNSLTRFRSNGNPGTQPKETSDASSQEIKSGPEGFGSVFQVNQVRTPSECVSPMGGRDCHAVHEIP